MENVSFRNQSEVCQFSGYEEFSMHAFERQYVSYHITYILLTVINCILALTATTGNVLTLVAVWKTPSLQTPTNVLLSGLAVSDLGIGLFAQPGFVVSLTARLILMFNVWCPVFILMLSTSYLLITISFFTVTALSVERLLALQLHLRFQEFVTNTRVLLILTIIWLTGVLTQILRIKVTVSVFGCFTVSWVIVLTGVNIYCYRKIYQIVRRHQTQINVEAQVSQTNSNQTFPNISLYKKTIFTMLYIHGFFALCYIPMILAFFSVRIHVGASSLSFLLGDRSGTVVFLNSYLNPLLYCWRITEMRL